MRELLRRIRAALARRACRRYGHDWGPWRPTWFIFCQQRCCYRCQRIATAFPWDEVMQPYGRAVLNTLGLDRTPKAGD